MVPPVGRVVVAHRIDGRKAKETVPDEHVFSGGGLDQNGVSFAIFRVHGARMIGRALSDEYASGLSNGPYEHVVFVHLDRMVSYHNFERPSSVVVRPNALFVCKPNSTVEFALLKEGKHEGGNDTVFGTVLVSY